MNLAIVVGEVSGDIQAERLIRKIKELNPGVDIWGMGGPRMQEAGAHIVYDVTEWALIGFWEVLKSYGKIRKVFYGLLEKIKERKPSAVVLVDYPGFNLRLAKKIKQLGIPVIYYISPQVWAWGKGRVEEIKELVDKMIVIFPFEKEMYEKAGVPVEFVGHPFIDVLDKRVSKRDEFRRKFGIGSSKLIGILPGSREQEVRRHLPVLIESAKRIKNAKFIIGAASEKIHKYINKYSKDATVLVGHTYDIMEASDLVLTSSGTATLETACFGTPLVVIYKLNWITYSFIKRMIKIPYIAMANVVVGKKIVPELVQNDANADNIVKEAEKILNDSSTICGDLGEVRERLGSFGAVERAAKIICTVISD